VDQSAEEVTALDAHRKKRGRNGRDTVRRRQSERAVRPMLVVVRHIDAKNTLEMAATDDQETIEAVFAEGAHPALRIGVRVRCPHRCPDHTHTLGGSARISVYLTGSSDGVGTIAA
jgi:hypothetical protein